MGIATTAAALLDVGHAHGQQVAQPVEAMEETSAGTVDAGRKVRTMPRHGQLKPEKLLVKNGAQDGDYKVREV